MVDYGSVSCTEFQRKGKGKDVTKFEVCKLSPRSGKETIIDVVATGETAKQSLRNLVAGIASLAAYRVGQDIAWTVVVGGDKPGVFETAYKAQDGTINYQMGTQYDHAQHTL